jgi:hypothetical protein
MGLTINVLGKLQEETGTRDLLSHFRVIGMASGGMKQCSGRPGMNTSRNWCRIPREVKVSDISQLVFVG